MRVQVTWCFAAALFYTCVSACPAEAQLRDKPALDPLSPKALGSDRWVVSYTTLEDDVPAWQKAAAEEIASELEQQGARVMSTQGAQKTVMKWHSERHPDVTHSVEQQYLRACSRVQLCIQDGDTECAQESIAVLRELSGGMAAAVNRNDEAAKESTRSCLYEVRSDDAINRHKPLAQRRRRHRAMARQCRVKFPHVEIDVTQMPPWLQAIWKEVGALRKSLTIKVRVLPEAKGCTLLVNEVRQHGLAFNERGEAVVSLLSGKYHVGAECEGGASPRTYVVPVTEGEYSLVIDTEFDAAFRTEPLLGFQYERASQQDRRRALDAAQLVSAVRSWQVVLVAEEGPSRMRLDRLDFQTRRVTSVVLPRPGTSGWGAHVVEAAANALRAASSVAYYGESMHPIAPWTIPGGWPQTGPVQGQPLAMQASAGPSIAIVPSVEPGDSLPAAVSPTSGEPRADSRHGVGRTRTGAVMSVAGGLGLAAGWVLFGQRQKAGQNVQQQAQVPTGFVDDQRWREFRPGLVAAGVGGSVIATVGLGLALPEQSEVPWWGWTSGIVGLGVGAWGAVWAAGGARCEIGGLSRSEIAGCVDDESRQDAGVLVVSAALPLVSIPLTYLLRSALGGDVEAQVQAAPAEGRASWSVGGRF